MQNIKQAWLNFWHDLLPTSYFKHDHPEATQAPPHDLGHASKCVWELDKEA